MRSQSPTSKAQGPRVLVCQRGQSIVEFALVTPLLIIMALGVTEVSYALLHQHVVTRLSREGSNLISRDTTLQDAATAMVSMSSAPVNFSTNSTLIFSVVERVATIGAGNYNKDVLYQRYQFGSIGATSALTTVGSGSFSGAPNYQATNADNDTNLQVTNLPGSLPMIGGLLYVTEIYTTHQTITPLTRFGITVPTTLYSIAYF